MGATIRGRTSGRLTPAFRSGLAGVAVAWVAAIAVEMVVTATISVLHMGGLSVLMPIPFVIGYVLGFGLAAQRAEHVFVVQRVAEAVDRGGLVARLLHAGVLGPRLGEFPVLDLVYRQAADAHRPRLHVDRGGGKARIEYLTRGRVGQRDVEQQRARGVRDLGGILAGHAQADVVLGQQDMLDLLHHVLIILPRKSIVVMLLPDPLDLVAALVQRRNIMRRVAGVDALAASGGALVGIDQQAPALRLDGPDPRLRSFQSEYAQALRRRPRASSSARASAMSRWISTRSASGNSQANLRG